MKRVLIALPFILLAACNNQSKTESMKTGNDSSLSTTAMSDVTYPYDIMYSSKFEMTDPKYGQTILQLWKDWDNGNLSTHKEMFADSLELHTADGSMMKGTRDSVIAMAQNYRNSVGSAVSRVDAVTSLRSTDKNENWALVWGMETDTDKKGKIDSFYLQETWRFNKDGKPDLLYQFRQNSPPAMKK